MKKTLFVLAVMTIAFVGCKKEEAGSEKWPSTPIPTDEIHYTSSDGEIIEPEYGAFGGGTIVSNTYENGIGIIKFDEPVTSLGHSVFKDCETLTRIALPGSITTIRQWAFNGCKNLVRINIPESVIDFGDAFQYCESLTNIIIPNGVKKIKSETFWNCTNLSNVNIPNSVTSIGARAFFFCESLTDITIPNSVTEIGWNAFYGTNLTKITIPDSVTSIGYNAFEACFNLASFYGKFASPDNKCLIIDGKLNSFAAGANTTKYTIPNNVTTIGKYAFAYCRKLESVTIPSSVISIEEYAFIICKNLTYIYCQSIIPPSLGTRPFHNTNTLNPPILENLKAIYVPRASVDLYKSAEDWSEYIDLIQGYDF